MPMEYGFASLAEYNRWMNEKLYLVCAEIPDAERRRDRGAFFCSIHGTLNHILLADMLWLDRFYESPPRQVLSALDAEVCHDFGELRQARADLDAEILEFVAGLDADWLAQPMTFTSIVSPRPRTFSRWFTLQHFFNHQTHHRGQLTTLISQAGHDPGVTDLLWLPGAELTAGADAR